MSKELTLRKKWFSNQTPQCVWLVARLPLTFRSRNSRMLEFTLDKSGFPHASDLRMIFKKSNDC